MKDDLIRKKSRCSWLCDGDKNSKSFMRSRLRRNKIYMIKCRNDFIEDRIVIKNLVVENFQNRFKELNKLRLCLDRVEFNLLSQKDSSILEMPFSMKDLKDVIWSSHGDISLGPDIFGFDFYKSCYGFIREDLFECICEFFDLGHMSKAITYSFLALISKKSNPQDFNDFRPIFLIGSVYNIISKLLAGRLKLVIGKLISHNQQCLLLT